MGNIGDIYYSFRGDGARLQKDAQVEGAKAGTALGKSTVAKLQASWSGANIGKGFVQGLGLAGGLGAVTLISGAVSKFTEIIGDSVQAALKDEESQNRLAASLRANVPNWDGNTKAIEANILTKQRLGFEDETLRDSLTVLVGATHDVTKATEIQNTAMDLARFKGIDLQTASEALIKVEGGHYKMLAQLGINLRKNATVTEALAAVQKVAAGQAEAYAQTNKGKLEASQIAVGEAMENFGAVIMPAVVTITTEAAKVATDMAGTLTDLSKHAAEAGDILGALGVKFGEADGKGVDFLHTAQDFMAIMNPTKVSGTVGVMLDTIDKLGVSTFAARQQLADFGLDIDRHLPAAAATTETATGKMADDMAGLAGSVDGSLGKMEDSAVDWRDKFRDVSGAVVRSANKVRTKMAEIAQGIIDDFYDPIETRANLHDIRMKLLADKETARTAKTKEERRQAKDDVVADLHDEANALVKLGDQGKLTAADVARYAKDARSNYKGMSKSAIADSEAIIKKLQELARLKIPGKTVPVVLDLKVSAADRAAWVALTHHAWGHGPLLAEGGPVKKGQPYVVGDGGRPELFVPDQNGTVLPRVPTGTTTATGMGPLNLTVNLNGVGSDVSPQTARRFGQNVLDVVADGLREQTARSA